jgi:2-aminoadipate transaminase
MPEQSKFSFEGLYSKHAPEGRPRAGSVKRGKYDFAVAYPDPKSIPFDGLVDGLQQALSEEGEDLAMYAHPQGYRPLREFVAGKLARERDIHVSPDEIILGDGSGQPIHMFLEVLIDPGDVALTEDYVYAGTLGQLRRFGADVRGVETDEEGMVPDSLESAIERATSQGRKPKLIYTIPTYQNPQGWTMTLERRQAMVEIANRHGVPILEDDCYVDLRLDGPESPTSIHSLDETGSVMYVASFSKIIAPGMRIGYGTGPSEVLDRALVAKSGGSVNTFASYAVHRYSIGQLDSHIEEINDIQRAKRDAMVASLGENFGDRAAWSNPHGGLFVWLKMPDGSDLTSIRDTVLNDYDVGYLPGVNFSPEGTTGHNYARLCFGYNQPDEVYEGIARLAEAFENEGAF